MLGILSEIFIEYVYPFLPIRSIHFIFKLCKQYQTRFLSKKSPTTKLKSFSDYIIYQLNNPIHLELKFYNYLKSHKTPFSDLIHSEQESNIEYKIKQQPQDGHMIHKNEIKFFIETNNLKIIEFLITNYQHSRFLGASHLKLCCFAKRYELIHDFHLNSFLPQYYILKFNKDTIQNLDPNNTYHHHHTFGANLYHLNRGHIKLIDCINNIVDYIRQSFVDSFKICKILGKFISLKEFKKYENQNQLDFKNYYDYFLYGAIKNENIELMYYIIQEKCTIITWLSPYSYKSLYYKLIQNNFSNIISPTNEKIILSDVIFLKLNDQFWLYELHKAKNIKDIINNSRIMNKLKEPVNKFILSCFPKFLVAYITTMTTTS